MKKVFNIITLAIFSLLFTACEADEEELRANLTINHIDFAESYRNVAFYLPDGVYMPDNPDFDIDNPDTWTGNMAKYVNHNYVYSITYSVKNTGNGIAHDTEIDLHFIYDTNEEKIETVSLGEIEPDESVSKTYTLGCTNKQLITCNAEVFWYD